MGTILKNGINYSGTSGGSGVSSYTELTEKPKIEGVTLTGNKTASDLGLAKSSDVPSTDTCYMTSDAAFTDLADADYVPMYDSSASAKKKTLWSNVKSVLKTYFDTIYSTVKTRGTAASGGTTLSLVNTGDMYTWNNKQNTLTAGTNITISSNTISASMPVLGTINRSDIYSTTEKVIGCWTDGRPIYQKTVNFGALPNNATKDVAHGISNINVIINVNGYAKSGNANYYSFPVVSTTNIANGVSVSANATNVRIQTGTDYSSVNAYVVLQYTKTTDSANSYNYANENDYSTSEKIVGTWIDGKPLYQKTISCGALPNATSKDVAHGISNLNRVISIEGYAFRSSDNSAFPINRPSPINDNNSSAITCTVKGNYLVVQTGSDRSAFAESYVTLQYTKTT